MAMADAINLYDNSEDLVNHDNGIKINDIVNKTNKNNHHDNDDDDDDDDDVIIGESEMIICLQDNNQESKKYPNDPIDNNDDVDDDELECCKCNAKVKIMNDQLLCDLHLASNHCDISKQLYMENKILYKYFNELKTCKDSIEDRYLEQIESILQLIQLIMTDNDDNDNLNELEKNHILISPEQIKIEILNFFIDSCEDPDMFWFNKLFGLQCCNINGFDEEGINCPLFAAVASNNSKIIELLLERGANLNIQNSKNENALHVAIYKNSVQSSQILIQHGIDINCKDSCGQTPAIVCLRFLNESRKKIFKSLIQNKEIKFHDDETNECPILTNDQHFLLSHAALSNDVECFESVKQLYDTKSSKLPKEVVLKTLSHLFTINGTQTQIIFGLISFIKEDFDIISFIKNCLGHVPLVNLSNILSDVEFRDKILKSNSQILSDAIKTKRGDIIEFFLKIGAKLHNNDDLNLLLGLACSSGNLKLVIYLLSKGAQPKLSHFLSVFQSGSNDFKQITNFLLQNEILRPQLTMKVLEKALMIACESSYLRAAKYLVLKKVSVNFVDESGRTPLIKACIKGDLEMVKFLVENGASVVQRSKELNGLSPITISCQMPNNIHILQYLLSLDIDISRSPYIVTEAIFEATRTGFKEILALVIKWAKNLKIGYFDQLSDQNIIQRPHEDISDKYPIKNIDNDKSSELNSNTTQELIPNHETKKIAPESDFQSSKEDSCDSDIQENYYYRILSDSGDKSKYIQQYIKPKCLSSILDLKTEYLNCLKNDSDILEKIKSINCDMEYVSKSHHKLSMRSVIQKSRCKNRILKRLVNTNNPGALLQKCQHHLNTSIKSNNCPQFDSNRLHIFDQSIIAPCINNTTHSALNPPDIANENFLTNVMPSNKNKNLDNSIYSPSNVKSITNNLDSPNNQCSSNSTTNSATINHLSLSDMLPCISIKNISPKDSDDVFCDQKFLKDSINDTHSNTLINQESFNQIQYLDNINNNNDNMINFIEDNLLKDGTSLSSLSLSSKSLNSQEEHYNKQQANKSIRYKKNQINLDIMMPKTLDTPLSIACSKGFTDTVSLLIDQGVNIEHINKRGFTPLMLAVEHDHLEVAQLLLANGAQINFETERSHDIALGVACASGSIRCAQHLIELICQDPQLINSLDHVNSTDYTPLCFAASGGYLKICEYLVESGALVDGTPQTAKVGITPLMLAVMQNHVDVALYLINNDASVHIQIESNKNSILDFAVMQNQLNLIAVLLDHGANMEHRSKSGLTPLMEAVENSHTDIVRLLINNGADCNAVALQSQRDSVLTLASSHPSNLDIVMILVKDGHANVEYRNRRGSNAFWIACSHGFLDIVKFLTSEAKCDLHVKDSRGISAIFAAFKGGHLNVVEYLSHVVSQFPREEEIIEYLSTFKLSKDQNDVDQDAMYFEHLLANMEECIKIIFQAKEKRNLKSVNSLSAFLKTFECSSKDTISKRSSSKKSKKKKQKIPVKSENCNIVSILPQMKFNNTNKDHNINENMMNTSNESQKDHNSDKDTIDDKNKCLDISSILNKSKPIILYEDCKETLHNSIQTPSIAISSSKNASQNLRLIKNSKMNQNPSSDSKNRQKAQNQYPVKNNLNSLKKCQNIATSTSKTLSSFSLLNSEQNKQIITKKQQLISYKKSNETKDNKIQDQTSNCHDSYHKESSDQISKSINSNYDTKYKLEESQLLGYRPKKYDSFSSLTLDNDNFASKSKSKTENISKQYEIENITKSSYDNLSQPNHINDNNSSSNNNRGKNKFPSILSTILPQEQEEQHLTEENMLNNIDSFKYIEDLLSSPEFQNYHHENMSNNFNVNNSSLNQSSNSIRNNNNWDDTINMDFDMNHQLDLRSKIVDFCNNNDYVDFQLNHQISQPLFESCSNLSNPIDVSISSCKRCLPHQQQLSSQCCNHYHNNNNNNQTSNSSKIDFMMNDETRDFQMMQINGYIKLPRRFFDYQIHDNCCRNSSLNMINQNHQQNMMNNRNNHNHCCHDQSYNNGTFSNSYKNFESHQNSDIYVTNDKYDDNSLMNNINNDILTRNLMDESNVHNLFEKCIIKSLDLFDKRCRVSSQSNKNNHFNQNMTKIPNEHISFDELSHIKNKNTNHYDDKNNYRINDNDHFTQHPQMVQNYIFNDTNIKNSSNLPSSCMISNDLIQDSQGYDQNYNKFIRSSHYSQNNSKLIASTAIKKTSLSSPSLSSSISSSSSSNPSINNSLALQNELKPFITNRSMNHHMESISNGIVTSNIFFQDPAASNIWKQNLYES